MPLRLSIALIFGFVLAACSSTVQVAEPGGQNQIANEGAPVADSLARTVVRDGSLPMTLSAQDLDGGPSAITFELDASPEHGTIEDFDRQTGTLVYVPASAYVGEDRFSYRAFDGENLSAPAIVSIQVIPPSTRNIPPGADPLTRQTNHNTALDLALSGNDPDGGPQALTFEIVSNPTHGSVALLNSSTARYTPADNFSGTDSFTYRAYDGADYGDAATISITVRAPTNVAPVATSFARSTFMDEALGLTLLATDSDHGPQALTYQITQNPAHGSISVFNASTGALTYTPASGYEGDDSIRFRAYDGAAYGNTATVTIQVNTRAAVGSRLFFLHHSVGRNLVERGQVRAKVATYNSGHGTTFEFWDQDYNYIGLRNASGTVVGNYNIPGDNTDPVGLYTLWTTDNTARTAILANHDVIAFKSCYPNSGITSPTMLAQYKTWYLAMRDFFDLHPEKVFVVMSTPPLNPAVTNSADAGRARAFANWLGSAEYLSGHPNIRFFNIFDELADPDNGTATANMLRSAYIASNPDSHPNQTADLAVAPKFVESLIRAAGGVWP